MWFIKSILAHSWQISMNSLLGLLYISGDIILLFYRLLYVLFKHICHQPLSNRRIKNIQCHQCPLRQCWKTTPSYMSTFLPFQNILYKPVRFNQWRHLNINPFSFPKQANVPLDASPTFKNPFINIINIRTSSPMIDYI